MEVDTPIAVSHESVLEYGDKDTKNKIIEFTVSDNALAAYKNLYELNLPQGSLVSLVYKKGDYIIPTAETVIEPCDVLFILMDKTKEEEVRSIICSENI